MGPRGGVVTQRSAKPFTPVQFWSWPPFSRHIMSNGMDVALHEAARSIVTGN